MADQNVASGGTRDVGRSRVSRIVQLVSQGCLRLNVGRRRSVLVHGSKVNCAPPVSKNWPATWNVDSTPPGPRFAGGDVLLAVSQRAKFLLKFGLSGRPARRWGQFQSLRRRASCARSSIAHQPWRYRPGDTTLRFPYSAAAHSSIGWLSTGESMTSGMGGIRHWRQKGQRQCSCAVSACIIPRLPCHGSSVVGSIEL
jgi:hypothetical protein